MHLAVRHNLQVFDPADPSLREDAAIVLPVREAQAVMGETVAAYLDRVAWRFDLPTVCRINGAFYGRDEWAGRALAVNDNVEFVSRPLGGGSSGGSAGKSILSVVALVALTAVAGPAGGALAGAAGFTGTALTVATSIASAVIVGAGSLAISHFLGGKAGGKSAATEQLYTFGFQGNAARPMQPIPVLNGRLRFAPDYAAPTYSEYAGDTMIDYALYALTCGRMRPEQVLIGDTPIWDHLTGYSPDYPGIELQWVEPGGQVTLYPVNVVTADELSGAELTTTFTPGYIVNAAGTQAKELLFDFVWPGGAYRTNKDKIGRADTHILIRIRPVDAAGAATGPWQEVFGKIYQAAKQSQIRITERFTVAPGRYEVSARRVNAPVADGAGTDAVTWTALRAHIDGPQSFPGVSVLAVKGVASKKLSGVSGGQLRVIGTRILPVWRDGLFVEEPTRSIAWAALDWWRNDRYAAGLSLSDVDFQAFVAYDALWTALGHSFDYRFTEVQNLDDVLETVLKAGRAFPAPVGDKLTITRDEPRGLSRMLFTENDIVRDSLEIDYALSDEAWADGVVGEYVDQSTWRLAEVSSAPEGTTLLKPARVQIQGVVDRKQATGVVRQMAAESQYRRITVAWTARMEGRLLKRGDLVKITAEEPETWGQSCEVTNIAPDGVTLTLDPPPVWEASGSHFVEIRRRDGRIWGPARVTRGRNAAEAIVSPGGDVTGLADALRRSPTQEAPWLAFSPGQPRTFPVLITEGDPDQDGEHIHLTGVIDAAEVYSTTENGVPPLLQIPDLFSGAMPVIVGLFAHIAQVQVTLVLTAGWQPAKNAASYVADVSYDGGQTWIRAFEGDRTTFDARVGGSDQMRVRVAGVTPAGVRGAFFVVSVEAPSLEISNERVGLIAIDYVDLIGSAKAKVDHILDVEKESRESAAAALARAQALDAKADAIAVKAKQDADAALARGNEAFDRALAAAAVGDANTAAIVYESQQRLTGDSAIASDLSAAVARIGGVEAGVVTERTARVEGDTAQATRLDAVIARTSAAEANITSEQTARINADGALASRIDVVSASTASNSALIAEERQARVDQISAEVRALNAYIAAVDGHGQGLVLSEQTARVNADGALATRIDQIKATADGNSASIVEERTARANADSAQASQIQGINVLLYDPNDPLGLPQARAGLVSERTARVDADGALSNRIDVVSASTASNSALIVEERQARVDSISAEVRGLNAYIAAVDGNGQALVLSEQTARVNADGALSTRIESVLATSNGNTASIQSVNEAITNVNSAMVSRTNDLYARSDRGTAVGRFEMQAQSGPSGVSARIAALVAVESYGQTRGAGWYVDLRDDGTSRFVVDADAFFITKNGSSIPTFSFDGQTLTIPSLRVLQSAFLPNTISQSNAEFTNDASISFTITTRPNARVSIWASYDGEPGRGLPLGTLGVLRIARDGTALRDRAINYYNAGSGDNLRSFLLATESFFRDAPPPGQHTYTISTTQGLRGVSYHFIEIVV